VCTINNVQVIEEKFPLAKQKLLSFYKNDREFMKDFIKRFNQRKNSHVFNSFHKLKYTLKSKRKECNIHN
jgi:hypothetical protein